MFFCIWGTQISEKQARSAGIELAWSAEIEQARSAGSELAWLSNHKVAIRDMLYFIFLAFAYNRTFRITRPSGLNRCSIFEAKMLVITKI